jgi:hypothetical protein
VAPWSSRCRVPVAGVPVRRRHGGVWLRAREDPAGAESQPGRADTGGPTSRPWVIWPTSVHGGTCGTTRARRVSAAAASAVSASPSRVACGARVLITSRSTRASQATPWVRSHSTWAGSRTARIQRRTVDNGRCNCAAIRGRWPATLHRSRPWCRPGVGPPRPAAGRGCRGRRGNGPAGVAAPRRSCRGRARCGPGRAPRAAADRCTTGRSASHRRGRSRPDGGRRRRSSGRGEGTAHERGLPGPRRPGVSWCGPHPAALRRANRVAQVGWARHVDDLRRGAGVRDAGTGLFIVTVAAPTNAVMTGHPSSWSTAGIDRQVNILGGGQQDEVRQHRLFQDVRVHVGA